MLRTDVDPLGRRLNTSEKKKDLLGGEGHILTGHRLLQSKFDCGLALRIRKKRGKPKSGEGPVSQKNFRRGIRLGNIHP